MKTLYLDCGMGAAGDMLAAALLELYPDKEGFLKEINEAGIPGVKVLAEISDKCGITGTHLRVLVHGDEEETSDEQASKDDHSHAYGCGQKHHTDHGHHRDDGTHDHEHGHHHDDAHDHEYVHHHSGMNDIREVISSLYLSSRVRNDALNVYRLIAEAESCVHGCTADEIHFHEVGTMDAVADIVAVSLLMEKLAPEKVLASPVHTGSGKVRCAHGLLPVPAPAAAFLLKDVPIYSGKIRGELCTPTGAALLKYFVNSFGPMPVMRVTGIGYGMGTKDFEAANCLRAFIGDTDGAADSVFELCCNLDDMTPEAVGFVQELLITGGALDVYTVPIGMKKNRPGIQLWCMCRAEKLEAMKSLLFRHTTTWGLRVNETKRFILERRTETVETAYGPVRVKSSFTDGVKKTKIEYEDLARIARDNGISFAEASKLLNQE